MIKVDHLYENQFIAGQWVKGKSHKIIENLNPYTQEEIMQIQAANTDDVDNAYQAASTAFKDWSKTAVDLRVDICHKVLAIIQARREEIVDLLISESGSTRLKANIEVDAALGIIQEASTYPTRMQDETLQAASPDQQSRVFRQALGVIAVISPWNFPFHLSMRSVITAIAIGNTVVLKPSSDTPITGGLLLGKIFEEAGIPLGVLNVVAGAGSEIGDYFVEHETPKLISFTGSTKVGKHVGQLAIASRNLKRLALELGGNAPLVILDDADIDQSVDIAVMGRFLHQGQICMSTNRIIVDEKVHDIFVEKLLQKISSLKVGDPSVMGTIVGPIINQQQISSIKSIIDKGQKDGAKLILSGEIDGNIIPPHVFTEVDPNSSLARDESFGPVLPIIKASNEEHALKLANDTEYGLSSAVCTQNYERGIRFARGIEAGMTHINDITVDDQPNAPFGGEKNSGLGRFNGHWLLEEFTRTHWVTIQKVPKNYPI
ncbi:aldehyde dehydrogenase family protein [Acinetobacter stercoris]|uniref:Putative aldehyde dehydrogenase YfmT n=1 Tax=Acinetobacter stercoris TaxID=2126983 RepID=A0A2U3N473_9GAMM|nr:aldehyde dehydrogenase family protein [Acinetobacter stercoris]SPL72471.1 putative aldehyde dehydrogenase YfmT [Acinetobacter stercoris]